MVRDSKDHEDRLGANSMLNHVLKNAMADDGGSINVVRQRTAANQVYGLFFDGIRLAVPRDVDVQVTGGDADDGRRQLRDGTGTRGPPLFQPGRCRPRAES